MSKDLTQKLNGSLEDKVDWLIAAVQKMDERLQNVEADTRDVKTRLASLETKVDKRLKDTTPMWEAVQAQLIEIRDEQQNMRGDLQRLRADTEKGLRIIDRRLEVRPIEMDRLNGYQRDLEERVGKIEKRMGE